MFTLEFEEPEECSTLQDFMLRTRYTFKNFYISIDVVMEERKKAMEMKVRQRLSQMDPDLLNLLSEKDEATMDAKSSEGSDLCKRQ